MLTFLDAHLLLAVSLRRCPFAWPSSMYSANVLQHSETCMVSESLFLREQSGTDCWGRDGLAETWRGNGPPLFKVLLGLPLPPKPVTAGKCVC